MDIDELLCKLDILECGINGIRNKIVELEGTNYVDHQRFVSREEFEYKFTELLGSIFEKIKNETGINITPEDLFELF